LPLRFTLQALLAIPPVVRYKAATVACGLANAGSQVRAFELTELTDCSIGNVYYFRGDMDRPGFTRVKSFE